MRVGRSAFLIGLAAPALLMLWLGLPAAAQEPLKGMALVIGQSGYEDRSGLRPLANPENDALDLRELFRHLGFKVTAPVLDADGDDLREAVAEFAADAAGADVAVVYYSGHGIEAAGQSYLIPVDADMSSPTAAGQSLVPLQELLAELQQSVKVTIVFFDACRTDSFAAGQQVVLAGITDPVTLNAEGLAADAVATRGGVLVSTSTAPDSLGAVIGFAASPDQPALDGEGGHSPYAAALLKHFGAGGYGLLDVMTMVTQEVYVETGARQLPWTEASLRGFVRVGTPVGDPDADSASIREVRRELLLSIASSPPPMRQLVETIAAEDGVPLDSLYGMLESLGVEAGPSSDLATQIEAGAERLKEFLDNPYQGGIRDAESERLARLVDEAIAEGAIDLAKRFGDQLIARVDAFAETLAEARVAVAADYAKGGAANALAFDFAAAAEAYRKAFEQVDHLDDDLAVDYKWREADALSELAFYRADGEALDRSIVGYELLIERLPRDEVPDDWAAIQNDLGAALNLKATLSGDPQVLQAAIDAYESALAIRTRERSPVLWARTMNNLAISLTTLGTREADAGRLEQAVETFEAALDIRTREAGAMEWAMTQHNRGQALYRAAMLSGDSVRMDAAIGAYRAALEVRTEADYPLDWAMSQNGLGAALQALAEAFGDADMLGEAVAAYQASLAAYPRETAPYDWAMVQNNIGSALLTLGSWQGDAAVLEEGVAALGLALEENTRDRAPLAWATAQNNLGLTLRRIGDLSGDPARIEAAIAAYRSALEVWTPEETAKEWADTNNNLGSSLAVLGQWGSDAARLAESATAYEAALSAYDRDSAPADWAVSQTNLGNVYYLLGGMSDDARQLEKAADAYRAALEVRTREQLPLEWTRSQTSLGIALRALGERRAGTDELLASAQALGEVVGSGIEQPPMERARSTAELGWTLVLLADREVSRETAQQGRGLIADALQIFVDEGRPEPDVLLQRLADADALIEALN